MEQQFIVKGPMAIVVTAFAVALGMWFDLHNWADADLKAAYSGTVVSEGTEYHIFGHPSKSRYIMILDSAGKTTRRYVDENGYMSIKVGSYVIKRAGWGEPRVPGSPLP